MFIWLGASSKSRKVRGGRTERAYCPECDEQTKFVEIEIRETFKLYAVIELADDTERAFRCTGCGAVGQIVDEDEVPAENRSHEARARTERTERAERLRALEAEKLRRERARRKREAKAEIELAELKREMGIAEPEPAIEPEPTATAPAKRWWKVWRR